MTESTIEMIRLGVVAAFIVFVVLPMVALVLPLASNFPQEDPSQSVSVIESLATPWWADIAVAAPILFVLLVAVLAALGLDDLL